MNGQCTSLRSGRRELTCMVKWRKCNERLRRWNNHPLLSHVFPANFSVLHTLHSIRKHIVYRYHATFGHAGCPTTIVQGSNSKKNINTARVKFSSRNNYLLCSTSLLVILSQSISPYSRRSPSVLTPRFRPLSNVRR